MDRNTRFYKKLFGPKLNPLGTFMASLLLLLLSIYLLLATYISTKLIQANILSDSVRFSKQMRMFHTVFVFEEESCIVSAFGFQPSIQILNL